jgi:TatD DNase family protein
MAYIDTHAHLDAVEFEEDRDEVVVRARRVGVEAIVCPAISADSSRSVLGLAEACDDIYAAVGIQPNYCAEAAGGDWDRVVAMAEHRRVVALGETGLDRHWDFTPFATQQDYFARHLALAAERNLPVIIHCREAAADLLSMLREAAARGSLRGVLHSFSDDVSVAAECVELGLFVSFAGAVTYTNKKFDPLRKAAASIPNDRLLIESDSPYLLPHPLRGRQTRNEPAHIALTAQVLAELRGVSLDQLARQTAANARRLFGIS